MKENSNTSLKLYTYFLYFQCPINFLFCDVFDWISWRFLVLVSDLNPCTVNSPLKSIDFIYPLALIVHLIVGCSSKVVFAFQLVHNCNSGISACP